MTLRITTRELADDRGLPELLPDPAGALVLRRGEGLAAWGRAATITVGLGPDRAARVAAHLRDLDVEGDADELLVLASLTFDRRRAGSRSFVPRRVVRRHGGTTRLVSIDPVEDDGPPPPEPGAGPTPRPHADRLRYAGSSLPDLRWLEAVDVAVDRIRAGIADKVVLARDLALWCEDPFDPRHLAQRLAATFPDCWTFLHDGLLGATPELLARREGDAVTSLVLAGTRGRAVDPDADRRLASDLSTSTKDLHEHRLAVASVTEGLDRLATSIRADDTPSVLTLDNVHHLATRVTATLVAGSRTPDRTSSPRLPTVLEIADHLHPTAAVGGTPRPDALAMIAELEGMDRGRYAAPVGWMDRHGDGEVALALRCARLSGARARLFAGVGLVAESLPEDELEETRLKLLAMQGALDGSAARGATSGGPSVT